MQNPIATIARSNFGTRYNLTKPSVDFSDGVEPVLTNIIGNDTLRANRAPIHAGQTHDSYDALRAIGLSTSYQGGTGTDRAASSDSFTV